MSKYKDTCYHTLFQFHKGVHMKATFWGLIENDKELVIEEELITYIFGFYKKLYMVEAMDDLVLETKDIYIRWILIKVNEKMNVELTRIWL